MTARRDAPVLVAALLALTFATGMIDAVSFIALGQVFTANMTGNVALLGFAPFVGDLSVPRSLTALLVFLVGAMAFGRLHRVLAAGPSRRWIAAGFASEAALVLACAAATLGHPSPISDDARAYAVIAILGFAMGVRNANVRRIGLRDLATTVVTSSLADLGMGLALPGRHGRWKRAAASALVLGLGAAAGALMLRVSVTAPLAASGVIAAACALAVLRASDEGFPAPRP
jgi:uncharacterized membrane protein YoaK (UPF0700 family)